MQITCWSYADHMLVICRSHAQGSIYAIWLHLANYVDDTGVQRFIDFTIA